MFNTVSRSSRGLGHRPFTAVTGVRLPYGIPCGSLAQLVEQLTFNQLVAGSNPARPTILLHEAWLFIFIYLESEGKGTLMWAISSVGRAPALQAGGHWFEPGIAHHSLSIFGIGYVQTTSVMRMWLEFSKAESL